MILIPINFIDMISKLLIGKPEIKILFMDIRNRLFK